MFLIALAGILPLAGTGSACTLASDADDIPKTVREILVPFDDLHTLLQDQPGRVLLSRDEYEALLRKAHTVPIDPAPYPAGLASADYTITVKQGRAELVGKFTVEVVQDGLYAVGLDVDGVGLRGAALDGKGASMGRSDAGRLVLFVEGTGSHDLLLDMVAPIEATAALQSMSFEVPVPAGTRMRLIVEGDVRIKSGADVLSRVFDEADQVTRFEILPKPGRASWVMTLNNRTLQSQRAVSARSLMVHEITEASEILDATFSMTILHRPVDQFRFAIPDGFEVTKVETPLLSRWAIEVEKGEADERPVRRVLDVRLREQTNEPVVITLSALRTNRPDGGAVDGGTVDLDDWSLPKLLPLEVVGQAAVIGLLLGERLKIGSMESDGLIPIDATVLTGPDGESRSIRTAVFGAQRRNDPREPAGAVRAVAAFYAPTGASGSELRVRFEEPPARFRVTTNLLLILGEKDLQLRGGFSLKPQVEELFSVDLVVPERWHIVSVSDADGGSLRFEVTDDVSDERPATSRSVARSRVRVVLPDGVAPGEERSIYVHAAHTPVGWLSDWESSRVVFPALAVAGAARDVGAIAIQAGQDMVVLPETVEGLTPLDEKGKRDYGLADVSTADTLAYRYVNLSGSGSLCYEAAFGVERLAPRLTARSYSFVRFAGEVMFAHYEIVYEVEEARAERLSFLLPISTPSDVSVVVLEGPALKEYRSEPAGDMRRWSVSLADGTRDTIRLAVDFEQGILDASTGGFSVPIVRADGVVYQSGVVAVQGSGELDLEIVSSMRKVDVGELAGARRRSAAATGIGRSAPVRRSAMGEAGVFAFVGDDPVLSVRVSRHLDYALPPAIVQRAEMATVVSGGQRPSGGSLAQTVARFQLRTKAAFLEVELPAGSTLWSIEVDGKPAKPQRQGRRLMVSLPAGIGTSADTLRDLRIVYETPIDAVAFWGGVEVPAPRLAFRMEGEEATMVEVPVADLDWRLWLPSGFRVVDQSGTVTTEEIAAPEPAAWPVARALYRLTGGVDLFYWMPSLARARQMSRRGLDYSGGLAGIESMEKLRGLGYIGREDADEDGVREPYRAADAKKASLRGMRGGELGDSEQLGEKVYRLDTAAVPAYWALEGVRSLKIDIERSGESMLFRSLGVGPRLNVTLANWRRVRMLGFGLATVVGLIGVALARRSAMAKARYVAAVGLAATLVPLIIGRAELAHLTNPAFYAASLLVPFYVAAWIVTWCGIKVRRVGLQPIAVTAVIAFMLVSSGAVQADPIEIKGNLDDPLVVRVVDPVDPLEIPEDAIIVPYDPKAIIGLAQPTATDRVWIPYARYTELWSLAYPDVDGVIDEEPPADYALAGAFYAAALEGDDYVEFDGTLDIDVFTDQYVAIELELGGGVLTRALLDGEPARLTVTPPDPELLRQSTIAPREEPPSAMLTLEVKGKGPHRLDVTVRMTLSRRGGWRVMSGRLPVAPATLLKLRVPHAGTRIRIDGVRDQRIRETQEPGETIETALGEDGLVAIMWAPKVRAGHVDPTLTADSEVLFDVREDGLRMIWKLDLEFGRTERESLTLELPHGYLVESVDGENVRAWTVMEEGSGSSPARSAPREGGRTLEVVLLKPTTGSESVVMVLHRRAAMTEGELSEFEVPVIHPTGAALHQGRITIRQHTWLILRTMTTIGLTRTDFPAEARELAQVAGGGESPFGVGSHQAYRFAASTYTLGYGVSPAVHRPSVEVQTILRIAEHQRTLESRVNVDAGSHPVYRVRIVVPDDLEIEHVAVPRIEGFGGEAFDWSVIDEGDRRVLAVHLANGLRGRVPIVIRGKLGKQETVTEVRLPRLKMLDVRRQRDEIVVQVDPAFALRVTGLKNCYEMTLDRVGSWLAPEQRPQARLALRCTSGDYDGLLQVSLREPDVKCTTITNVRITETVVEETILLSFTVTRAGLRTIAFLLPRWMEDSRITVPLLRQKSVEPVSDDPDAMVRVRLVLQDDAMGELAVLVENDRLLTRETHEAPIPIVETGRTDHRYVALESAGRDEVVIENTTGLEALSHRQREWRTIARVLGGGITEAYVVKSEEPVLAFKTTQRVAAETAGARIGLAQAILVADDQGAYRAEQSYRIDNRTEQFLEVELPVGAELWSVLVASSPVKPAKVPGAASTSRVRIPLTKTAAGDLDYEVVLKYAGQLPAPGGLRTVHFPLVRTVNVPVELSQVRLFLPETHRWFDFGGTMRQVGGEGDLAAGYVRYNTRLTDRLVQAMQSDSDFGRVRAAESFKNLRQEIDRFGKAASTYAYNEDLKREVLSNEATVQQAEEQLQQLAEKPRQEIVDEDNRAKLNLFFDQQQTTRARNLVQDLPRNFADPGGRGGGSAGGRAFDRLWLGADVSSVVISGPDRTDEGDEVILKQIQAPTSAGQRGQFQPQAPAVAQQEIRDKLAKTADLRGRHGKGKGRGGRQETQQLVAQYKQQLEQQSRDTRVAGEQVVQYGFSIPAEGETDDLYAGVPPTDGRAIRRRLLGIAATGLASLAVELPVRGVVYRFTTPRGDVSITARAVSGGFILSFERTAMIALAVAFFGGLWWLVGHRQAVSMTGSAGSTAMIVFGTASAVCGVLPAIGVAGIVAGIAVKVHRKAAA